MNHRVLSSACKVYCLTVDMWSAALPTGIYCCELGGLGPGPRITVLMAETSIRGRWGLLVTTILNIALE